MKMSKKRLLKRLKQNKGLMQFIARTLVFFAVLFGIQLSLMFYFRYTRFFIEYLQLGNEFYFSFLTGLRKTDFINAILFTVIIFLLWNRNAIKAFKPYRQNTKESFIFFILAVLIFVSHYIFKYFVKGHAFAENHTFAVATIKYSVNILFVVLLGIAVYNLRFLNY